MGDDAFTELKVKIAELATEFRGIAHDVKGALMKIEGLASVREVDAVKAEFATKLEATKAEAAKDLEALDRSYDARLKPIESLITWAGRIIVGTVLVALLALVVKARTLSGT